MRLVSTTKRSFMIISLPSRLVIPFFSSLLWTCHVAAGCNRESIWSTSINERASVCVRSPWKERVGCGTTGRRGEGRVGRKGGRGSRARPTLVTCPMIAATLTPNFMTFSRCFHDSRAPLFDFSINSSSWPGDALPLFEIRVWKELNFFFLFFRFIFRFCLVFPFFFFFHGSLDAR